MFRHKDLMLNMNYVVMRPGDSRSLKVKFGTDPAFLRYKLLRDFVKQLHHAPRSTEQKPERYGLFRVDFPLFAMTRGGDFRASD